MTYVYIVLLVFVAFFILRVKTLCLARNLSEAPYHNLRSMQTAVSSYMADNQTAKQARCHTPRRLIVSANFLQDKRGTHKETGTYVVWKRLVQIFPHVHASFCVRLYILGLSLSLRKTQ